MFYRVVTFVEQLLADEDDTGIAQFLALSRKRPCHLFLAVFDQGDGIALDADT